MSICIKCGKDLGDEAFCLCEMDRKHREWTMNDIKEAFGKHDKPSERLPVDLREWQREYRIKRAREERGSLIKSVFNSEADHIQWERDRVAEANIRGRECTIFPAQDPDEYPCYMLAYHKVINNMDSWNAYFIYKDPDGNWDLERLALDTECNQRHDK